MITKISIGAIGASDMYATASDADAARYTAFVARELAALYPAAEIIVHTDADAVPLAIETSIADEWNSSMEEVGHELERLWAVWA